MQLSVKTNCQRTGTERCVMVLLCSASVNALQSVKMHLWLSSLPGSWTMISKMHAGYNHVHMNLRWPTFEAHNKLIFLRKVAW